MLGSSISIACPNIILNTAVADELMYFADVLEKAEDFDAALDGLLRDTIAKHKRILFNGDGYSKEWEEEAARRGLMNLPSTVDALSHFTDDKNIALFERHGIYTSTEVHSRYNVLLDRYIKTVNMEARTMLELSRRHIIPAVSRYTADLAGAINAKRAAISDLFCPEAELLERIGSLQGELSRRVRELCGETDKAMAIRASGKLSALEIARFYRESVLPAMNGVRAVVDELEKDMPADIWPFPTYSDLLFKV